MPHRCLICGRTYEGFGAKGHLAKHIIRNHNEEWKEWKETKNKGGRGKTNVPISEMYGRKIEDDD